MKILRIFFIFFSIILFSQNVENFSVSTLSQDDGLSQGSNYFRFEDSHGFMWITGNDALNRYDGENVKVYNLKKYFENCPTLQQGYGITEDENSLYVGSTRGLYQYNYQKDIFTLIDFNKNSTLKNSSSKTIMPFGFFDGKVWCFNENYDVISYDTKSKILNLETKIPLEKIKSVHVYDNAGNVFYFRMPFFDKHNQICFTGKNKILLYNTKTKKIKEIPFNNGNEILCTSYVKSTDELFIGTKSNGILLFKNNYTSISSIKSKDKIIGCIGANENYIAYNTNRKFFLINRKNNQEIAIPQHNTTNYYTFDKIGRLWTCKDGFGEVILNFSGNFLKNSNDIQSTDFKFTAGVGYFSELSNNNVYIQSKAVFNTKKTPTNCSTIKIKNTIKISTEKEFGP
jgi:ligand-binding sensor domain-containing protein